MKKLRIGIFGSAMDPITMAHLVSAHEMAKRRKLDKVIFLPSSNKRENKKPHTTDEHRLKMLKLAIADNPKFEVSDYEMKQEAWNIYTYHTMNHFKKVYPDAELYFLMGADLLQALPGWKYGEQLISENKFIVIKRTVKGKEVSMEEIMARDKILRRYEEHFDLINKSVATEISSTFIREEFEFGRDPRYYMPEAVYQYINDHKLYRKEIKE